MRIEYCQCGIWVKDRMGCAAGRKPSKFLTNSPCIAEQLQRRCPGRESHEGQRYASLFYGVSKQAQVYPNGLVDAVCKGIQDQIERDRKGQFDLAMLDTDGTASAESLIHAMWCSDLPEEITTKDTCLRRYRPQLPRKLTMRSCSWPGAMCRDKNWTLARSVRQVVAKSNTSTKQTCTRKCPGARPKQKMQK